MPKSGRRDGFSKVFSHDADLKPANCGGPIFDLDGNFVGLNIARNSRVRSYAIPRAIINRFVAAFNGETVIDVTMEPAISTNPYFQFDATVPEAGEFTFTWYDDDGDVYESAKKIKIG